MGHQTRDEGIRESAGHCASRLIALGLLKNEDDEKAQEVIESYIENVLQRHLAGEWSR